MKGPDLVEYHERRHRAAELFAGINADLEYASSSKSVDEAFVS
jgi:hypothetical protein